MLVAATALVVSAPLAHADIRGWGPRAGLGFDPDQFVVGLAVVSEPILGPALLSSTFDLGVGDDVTIFELSLDLRWDLIPVPDTGVFVYGAIGPTLVIADYDGGSNTDIGIGAALGLEIPSRGNRMYDVEIRLGLTDEVPDVRILLGILL
jgi:hypothetical protein